MELRRAKQYSHHLILEEECTDMSLSRITRSNPNHESILSNDLSHRMQATCPSATNA
jgi:hypothetical protein